MRLYEQCHTGTYGNVTGYQRVKKTPCPKDTPLTRSNSNIHNHINAKAGFTYHGDICNGYGVIEVKRENKPGLKVGQSRTFIRMYGAE